MTDGLNVLFGLVSIVSLIFAIWTHLSARQRELVEKEKAFRYLERLRLLTHTARSLYSQGVLIVTVSDRDETTKKELKHLAVALISGLTTFHEAAAAELTAAETSSFGKPTDHVALK